MSSCVLYVICCHLGYISALVICLDVVSATNCLYNLSKTRLVRINSDVLELDGLLVRSGISSLEHGRGFAVNRKLFGVGSFSTKIARYE